jgi:hypothetical protein
MVSFKKWDKPDDWLVQPNPYQGKKTKTPKN